MAGIRRICVEVPDVVDADAVERLFDAVADAAYEWEPEDRDGWDIDVYAITEEPCSP